MASCPGCGADIQHVQLEDGSKIPLETYTEPTGSRRYTVVSDSPPLIARLVAEDNGRPAYPDHRLECPDHQNGVRR